MCKCWFFREIYAREVENAGNSPLKWSASSPRHSRHYKALLLRRWRPKSPLLNGITLDSISMGKFQGSPLFHPHLTFTPVQLLFKGPAGIPQIWLSEVGGCLEVSSIPWNVLLDGDISADGDANHKQLCLLMTATAALPYRRQCTNDWLRGEKITGLWLLDWQRDISSDTWVRLNRAGYI